MQFKIFTIPAIQVSDDGSATEEMNRFLRSHKVLETEQQLVSTKSGTHWHFCIKDLANIQPDKSGAKSVIKSQNSSKVDYKDILDEKTFTVFSILRDIRKKIAEEADMPIYAIFTNEELAGIATLDEIQPKTIKTVNGVGEKKTNRFGKPLAHN